MHVSRIFALVAVALLAVTSAGVLAHSTEEVNDWWQEMKEHYEAIHGDDFEDHHQTMHGDNWREHVIGCHSDTEYEDMHRDEYMGSGMGSMM